MKISDEEFVNLSWANTACQLVNLMDWFQVVKTVKLIYKDGWVPIKQISFPSLNISISGYSQDTQSFPKASILAIYVY